MDVLKALELLQDIPLKTDNEDIRSTKVKAIRTIDEQLTQPVLRNSSEFHKLLSYAIHALLRMLQDSDMNVWSLSEQALVKTIKLLNRTYHEWIVYEIWKGMKGVKVEGRSRRFAIELFALQSHRIQPAKAEQFRLSLLRTLVAICKDHTDQLLQEALAKHIEPILQYQLANAPLLDMTSLLDELTCNISSPHSRVRRSAAHCLAMVCKYHRQHTEFIRATVDRMYHLILLSANKPKTTTTPASPSMTTAVTAAAPEATPSPNQSTPQPGADSTAAQASTTPPQYTMDNIVAASSVASTYVLQGVLHAFRQLLRVATEFAPNNVFHIPNPMLPNLIPITEMAVECLKSDDNNVIVTSLELLQEILKSYWTQVAVLSNGDAKIEELVKRLDPMLHGGKKVRVSVQVLIVACSSQLALVMSQPFKAFIKPRINSYVELLKHSDPLLRGEAYYFVGCLISGYLSLAKNSDWELDVYSLLWTLLHSIMKDESSIAAKMACQSLAITVEPVMASQYAFFVPVMLQHLMCLPSNSYLLLKSKVLSLISKCDFRMVLFLEASVRDFRSQNPNVVVPEQLTLGQNPLQTEAVDFVISFLDDNDHRIRHKAGKVLVKLIPQLHYAHYFDNASKRKSAVCQHILDIQTSHHMSRTFNNHFKEPTDWLLWRMVGKINQSVDSVFLKGFYHFLRQLLEESYPLPGQFVSIILDQLACSSLATDIDAQLDIVIMTSHLVEHLTGDMATYVQKIFVHLVRILNILTSILQSKPIPPFKESRPGVPEGPIGSVQGQPQYLQLWERLQDTYRVSLTALQPNLFDSLCHETILGVARVVRLMGRAVVPYVDELLSYLPDHFETEPDAVVEGLQALVFSSLSDSEIVTPLRVEPVIGPSALHQSSGDAACSTIVDLVTPSFEHLLHSSHIDTDKLTEGSSEPHTIRRKLAKSFEPLFALVIERYDKVQNHQLRAQVLKTLGAVIEREADYSNFDKDFKHVRFVHQNIMRAQHPANSQPPKPHALAVIIGDVCAAQLSFLYLIHFRAAINLVGSFFLSNGDLGLLIPICFYASWSPENLGTFVDIASHLFLENLEARLRRKRKDAEKAKVKKAPATVDEEIEEEKAEIALVHDTRREFVGQLLELLPDANAAKLIKVIISTLKRYSDLSPYTEFSKLIAAKLQHLVTDCYLLSKNSVTELFSLFEIVDQLPQEAFDLSTLVGALLTQTDAPKPSSVLATPQPAAGVLVPVQGPHHSKASIDEPGRKPELWEKRLYFLQGHSWLPQTILVRALAHFTRLLAHNSSAKLFRMLLKFPESFILSAMQKLHSTADVEAAAQIVANALGSLLKKAAETFASPKLPLALRTWWSRLSAVLTHFIVYFVDSSRKSATLRNSLRAFFESSPESVDTILSGFLSSTYSGGCFILGKLLANLALPSNLEALLRSDSNRTWSWHSEVLQSVVCVILAKVYNQSPQTNAVPFLFSDTKFLTIVSRQINDESIKKLVSESSQPVHAKILQFVEDRMIKDAKLEMMSPQNVHELLLTLTQLPGTEAVLKVLFKYFAINGYISVQIACEHYLLNLMNRFHVSKDEEEQIVDDAVLKRVIEDHKDKLRPSFVRRLRKMAWLSLVSLSQQDLPTLASDAPADPKPTTTDLASSVTSDDSDTGSDENIAKLLAAKSTEASANAVEDKDGGFVATVPGSSLTGPSFIKYFFHRDNSNHLKVIQTLCAVLPVSVNLFIKVLQSPLMTPYSATFVLFHSMVSKVKEPMLRYVNDEISKWLFKNGVQTFEPLVVSDTTAIIRTSSSPRRGSLVGGAPSSPAPSVLSPPMSPEIKSTALLPSVGLFSPSGPSVAPPATEDPAGVTSPTKINPKTTSMTESLIEPDENAGGDSPSLGRAHPETEDSHGAGVDSEALRQEITNIKTKFRLDLVLANDGAAVKEWRSTLELASLIALVLHRFGANWPTTPGSERSSSSASEDLAVNPGPAAKAATSPTASPGQSPTSSPGISPLASPASSPPASPRSSVSEPVAPFVNLEGGALLAVATTVLERLLFLHERKVSILSTHDFVIVLSMLRQLFEVFQFTSDTFKKMESARRLLYHLYELYFILFKPDKKEILNYSSFSQVDIVFSFFWNFLRERPWLRADIGLLARPRGQEAFGAVLQALAQSSASLCLSVFPLQPEPINFDSHNEPVHVLENFSLLINSLHPNYPTVFEKIWENLYSGVDPEADIPAVATSPHIKAITIRGLTHLLLRAVYKANKWNNSWMRIEHADYTNPETSPVNLDRLRNYESKQTQWKGLQLPTYLTQLINVIRPYLESYSKGRMQEPQTLLECLRAVVLLSDMFIESQFQWMLDIMLQIAESQVEPWDEDSLGKQYAVLGFCKAAAVLRIAQPNAPDVKSAGNYPWRIQKIMRYLVQNLKMREIDISEEKRASVPIAIAMYLLALLHVLESKRVMEFKQEEEITKWLLAQTHPESKLTPYARYLARQCWIRLTANTTAAAPAPKPSNAENVDFTYIEELKNLFGRIRKSPLVQVERLAKTTIPAKLVSQHLNYDHILSFLFNELAKADSGVQNIALILYHVISKLKQDKSSDKTTNINALVTRWIIMCLQHFVILSGHPKLGDQAPWALTALFLTASLNPLQRVLFFDLIADPDLHVDEKILQLAGVDFYCNQNLDLASKRELIKSLEQMKGEAFKKLLKVLRQLLQLDEAKQDSSQ